jgi:hypothetical protein
MALFSKLSAGAGSAPAREQLEPGSSSFAAAARHDYAQLLELYGAPKLTPSFLVKTPPPAVQAAVDTFVAQHGGVAEVALNAIDGHRTYQVQVSDKVSAQVLLVDARGHELARGVARGASVRWR